MTRFHLVFALAATAGGFLMRWVRQGVDLHGMTAVLGWGPSLLYAFGLVVFLLSFHLSNRARLAMAAGGATGAVLYEFAQVNLAAHRTFDPGDVVATLIGIALAFAVDRLVSTSGGVRPS